MKICRIRKPIPKLDNDRIMGARGVHTLEELFADFKPRGKGREFEDLDVVMKKMEHWAHRLFPKLPFNSVLDIIANRLGKRKVCTNILHVCKTDGSESQACIKVFGAWDPKKVPGNARKEYV